MANHLIKKATLELVEGATKEEFDALSERVDSIVAENTTNATGFDVVTLTETVNQDADNIISYYFDVPANAVIVEAAYRAAVGMNTMWKTDNLKVWQTSTQVHMQVDNYSDAGTAEFKLVYTVPKPIELQELTDIRIGYDGTEYGSAGEAVRRQIGALAVANSGFNEQVKAALLNLLSKVAYVDGNGQQYYDELEQAMNQALGVTFITAVFEQGEAVIYDTDSLDALKQYLTVTAHYEDGTSGTVTSYTLSGTLTEGTSTITVSYGGKTATFDVTVTENQPLYPLPSRTKTLSTSGETITVSNGNHIRIDFSKALTTSTGNFMNLSNLSLNGANSASNSSAINNLQNILFTVPANQTAVLRMENITQSKTDLISASNGQFLVGLRKTAESSSISGFNAGYSDQSTDKMESSVTLESATNISCLILYCARINAVSVEFDITLYVDGVRYI